MNIVFNFRDIIGFGLIVIPLVALGIILVFANVLYTVRKTVLRLVNKFKKVKR